MMGGTYGIKETGEAVDLVAGVVKAVGGAYTDGKFGLEDLAYLIPVSMLVQPAVDGAGLIVSEMKELDEADEKLLKEKVDLAFGVGAFEMIGEDILLAAVHLLSAVAKIKKTDVPVAPV